MAAEIKQLFEGKWTVFKSDNFEAYLDKMGVGMIKKKMATSVNPTMTVSVEGETINVAMTVGPKTNKTSFQVGVEFETDGDMLGTAKCTFADGVWTMNMTPKDEKKGKPQTITRKIENGELVQTMDLDGVVCKRFFKRA